MRRASCKTCAFSGGLRCVPHTLGGVCQNSTKRQNQSYFSTVLDKIPWWGTKNTASEVLQDFPSEKLPQKGRKNGQLWGPRRWNFHKVRSPNQIFSYSFGDTSNNLAGISDPVAGTCQTGQNSPNLAHHERRLHPPNRQQSKFFLSQLDGYSLAIGQQPEVSQKSRSGGSFIF